MRVYEIKTSISPLSRSVRFINKINSLKSIDQHCLTIDWWKKMCTKQLSSPPLTVSIWILRDYRTSKESNTHFKKQNACQYERYGTCYVYTLFMYSCMCVCVCVSAGVCFSNNRWKIQLLYAILIKRARDCMCCQRGVGTQKKKKWSVLIRGWHSIFFYISCYSFVWHFNIFVFGWNFFNLAFGKVADTRTAFYVPIVGFVMNKANRGAIKSILVFPLSLL